MSVYCIKEIEVCSTQDEIEKYWKSINVYEKYITPYAFYAKWTEFLLKDTNIVPPEVPIKLFKFGNTKYFYTAIVTYLVYKTLHTETPFTLYFDGYELSTSNKNNGLEIEITPSQVIPTELPVIMQTIVELLQGKMFTKAEMTGIKIKNVLA
jgi:hypothetical protein